MPRHERSVTVAAARLSCYPYFYTALMHTSHDFCWHCVLTLDIRVPCSLSSFQTSTSRHLCMTHSMIRLYCIDSLYLHTHTLAHAFKVLYRSSRLRSFVLACARLDLPAFVCARLHSFMLACTHLNLSRHTCTHFHLPVLPLLSFWRLWVLFAYV
ncbi:hypothetical protein BDR07DRAFT_1432043 [Suillus spraguei]|nr:hypothetical protein BDR07DRAFT_1432043 [Suillus spraguei]